MAKLTVDNLSFFYKEAGTGTPIVFLHGFSIDHRMWTDQLEYFSKDYRVICPDARGHGLSAAPEYGYSHGRRVEDLAGLVDQLDISSFHLVGLSMGGTTALGYALEHENRLKSLTLVSTGAAGYNKSQKINRLDQIADEDGIKEAIETWRSWTVVYYEKTAPELAGRLDKMMAGFPGGRWLDPNRYNYPQYRDMEEAEQLSVPTAIFAGAEDKQFVEIAESLHSRIKPSRLKIYPGTGHMLNMQIPGQFNQDLSAFLKEVTP